MDESLRRLNTDYIDVLQIHRFDYNVTMEETMEALHDLIKMGKVRYIGASSMLAHEFVMLQSVAERNGWSKFISMQNQYSLLYREEEREMNKYCDRTGVGLIPVSTSNHNRLLIIPNRYSLHMNSVGGSGIWTVGSRTSNQRQNNPIEKRASRPQIRCRGKGIR